MAPPIPRWLSRIAAESFTVGARWPLGGTNVSTIVFETGRSARLDSYGDPSGPLSAIRERGLRSSVGARILVVVAEALTNVVKHARAGHAEVTARIEDGALGVRVGMTVSEAPDPTAPASSG